MSKSIYKEILEKLPPSSQNGTRSYVLRKLDIFRRYPSEARKQELEDIVDGLSIDYTDRDHFDGDLIIKE